MNAFKTYRCSNCNDLIVYYKPLGFCSICTESVIKEQLIVTNNEPKASNIIYIDFKKKVRIN